MQTIRLSEYGIFPDTDITLALKELFIQHPTDTVFVFEEGDYYFSPYQEMHADYRLSNSAGKPYRVLGLWMKYMERCILQGNGARLWFTGQMQSVTMDHCQDIEMRDFVINWKKPLVAEGIVVSCTDDSVDLYINPMTFPHRFVNEWLEFDIGAEEWYPLNAISQIQYTQDNRCIRRETGDRNIPKMIENRGNNIYHITYHQPVDAAKGDIFILRHNDRMHAGIFSEKCKNILLEDIVVHSCGGLGCLAQFCHNLTFRRIHFIPDTKAGREIANGRDDGIHLTCNSGTVTVTECTFLGLMDDPINIHGCCVTSDEVVDSQTLRCRYRHAESRGFHYWSEQGDEIAFIDRKHMSQAGTAKAASYTLESHDTFLLTFQEPLSREILLLAERGEMLALDNLSNTASFVCTKNRFGSCRARGVLVSTPKSVVIAKNYFESSGSAILVAGDSNYWFESGACKDIDIHSNVFTDHCLSSMYQFCEGIISICPVVPDPLASKPYHRNIRITDNTFDSAEVPVLYAYSCEKLTFSQNRIFKSPSANRWHPSDCQVKLSYCRDVSLQNNDWIGKFDLDSLVMTKMCENVVGGSR